MARTWPQVLAEIVRSEWPSESDGWDTRLDVWLDIGDVSWDFQREFMSVTNRDWIAGQAASQILIMGYHSSAESGRMLHRMHVIVSRTDWNQCKMGGRLILNCDDFGNLMYPRKDFRLVPSRD